MALEPGGNPVILSRGNGTMLTQRNRMTHLSALAALMIAAGAVYWISPSSAETARKLPPPAVDEITAASREVAILAGGCFWGVQEPAQEIDGTLRRSIEGSLKRLRLSRLDLFFL